MHLIRALCRLQAIDAEWDEKGRLFQEIRARLMDESELQAARRAQKAREERLATLRSALRDAELELQGLQQKVNALDEALYSGRVLAPRELDNMRRDSEYLKRRISAREDEALELMAEIEELEQETSRGAEALQAKEAQWAQERQNLRAQYETLLARLKAIKQEREQIRTAIDAQALATYDQLRRTKHGQALSAFRDGRCQTCHVAVPSNKARLVEEGQEVLVTCEGCGRILYAG